MLAFLVRVACSVGAMVMDAIQIHPRGLSVRTRARVLALRLSQKPPPFRKQIAKKIKNVQGHHPYWKVCRDA